MRKGSKKELEALDAEYALFIFDGEKKPAKLVFIRQKQEEKKMKTRSKRYVFLELFLKSNKLPSNLK